MAYVLTMVGAYVVADDLSSYNELVALFATRPDITNVVQDEPNLRITFDLIQSVL